MPKYLIERELPGQPVEGNESVVFNSSPGGAN